MYLKPDQDMASWTRDGIAGLQSVVLYSLPELDGAIDTVVRSLQRIFAFPQHRLRLDLFRWATCW